MPLLIVLLGAVAGLLPLGTRIFVHSFITGVHEYEAAFVYATDILLFLTILVLARRYRTEIRTTFRHNGGWFFVAWGVAGLAATIGAPSVGLALYSLVRMATGACFAFAVAATTREPRYLRIILILTICAGLAQSAIGFAQFKEQRSVGLAVFGEPLLESHTGAASTIRAEGGRVLRAYGTMPHPNVYGAFIMLAVLAAAYWYLRYEDLLSAELFTHPRRWWTMPRALGVLNQYVTHRYFYARLLLAACTFILIVALALSFSRSAWIATVVALLVLAVMRLWSTRSTGEGVRLLAMLAACTVVTYGIFAPIIRPRAMLTQSEPAVRDRLAYINIGLTIAENNPGGVGPGNQVLYGVEQRLYQDQGMHAVWAWEPVHTMYLLILGEYGLLGLLSFLVILGMVAWHLLRGEKTLERDWALAALAGVLTLGLFDHFLWTLQPGRLMLWLVIGLAIGQGAALIKVRSTKRQ